MHNTSSTLSNAKTHNKFSLSHIYTNMTFGLFTNIAPVSSKDIYLHICPFHWRICPFHWRRGSHRACNIRFFSFPIRRESFPNKLPLHSGMGCRTSPIRFRHASSLSSMSTLVSISDPFSAVWIFVSANSRSSTWSRIQ